MKVLYITNKPIFPVVDGGCKAMQQFLSCILKAEIEFDHMCLATQKHPFKAENYPNSMTENLSISSRFVQTKIRVLPALKNLIQGKSYNISRFDSPDFHADLSAKLSAEDFTHVVLESLYLTPYISTIRNHSKAKIIVRTHNVEHQIWEQYAVNTFNPIKKWYLKRLACAMKTAEISKLKEVDLLATISNTDAETFRNLGIKTPMVTIPVAMEVQSKKTTFSTDSIFFLGSMNWQPNSEAVDWLVSSIFPALKKVIPEVCLNLAGSFMNGKFPSDKNKEIRNHGFVENSTEFMLTNGILVLPIQSGSGVRMKLLEALSLGIPVVTTAVGAQGINDFSTVYSAETEEEFVAKIAELLLSTEKQILLGQKAFEYVAENYSTSTISHLIRTQFEQL
jgi:glycosyltransferase involved in cell wall biosynthesis